MSSNKDPTPLHTDIGDAANVCVFASKCTEDELQELTRLVKYDVTTTNFPGETKDPAALWHIFHRDVYEDLVG